MKQITVKKRSFRDIFCSTCGYSGHNKRTCTYVKPKKKKNSKFHYDLDKLKFTIGKFTHPSQRSNIFKERKEAERKEAERKEAERKEAEKEAERKEADKEAEVFQKASPEELLYRDLFVKTKFLEKNETCSICLHSFSQKFVWKLSCNHHFHYKCIEKWSDMENYTCPLCRQQYYYP